MNSITIGTKKIGETQPCFIVAEISANHRQDYKLAEEIVRAAARAGADAIKLQTYTPDTMTLDSDKPWFIVGGKDNPKVWKGQTFYELYKKAYTPWEWHAKLQKLAHSLGIEFFSTPFDDSAVQFLETLGVPCYKIASYEATDIPLLRTVASTGKPVIISVGFATLEEIELSLETLRENGVKDIVMLYCTTSYQEEPKFEDTNLRTMLAFGEKFNVHVGFSDNMGGIEAPILAAAMGASVIEKHIVLTHDEEALDDSFSIDEENFKKMVQMIRSNEVMKGSVNFGVQTEMEKHNRSFRRSLFAVKDIKKGEEFTKENVKSLRPAVGLEPKFFDEVLGKTAVKNIERGTPLSWDLILK